MLKETTLKKMRLATKKSKIANKWFTNSKYIVNIKINILILIDKIHSKYTDRFCTDIFVTLNILENNHFIKQKTFNTAFEFYQY